MRNMGFPVKHQPYIKNSVRVNHILFSFHLQAAHSEESEYSADERSPDYHQVGHYCSVTLNLSLLGPLIGNWKSRVSAGSLLDTVF